ncbi:MAG: DUF881 domain-containing protein [Candidatus Cryosericum sp.]|nr:DUF881 domain-containing protein [bacterium]
MNGNRRNSVIFLVVLFVTATGFGYLLAVQFEPTVNKAYVVPAQNVELVDIMQGLEAENVASVQRILDLRNQVVDFEARNAATSGEVAALTQRVQELRAKAGQTDMMGAGVVVTLSDSLRTPTLSDDPNYFVIHDGYLRSIVNLMRRYGAMAISINDQRILADSPIVCAGPIILVNSTRMSPPYVITALGDQDMLGDSISQDVFFRVLEMYRDQFGIVCSLEKKASLSVPASLKTSEWRYAKGAQ